jgi:hypothetical protein
VLGGLSLKNCVQKRCVDCGILFLTYPVNRKRNNLRCPFGCREHHKQKASSKRSLKYYQTEDGKRDKKERNRNRYIKTYEPKRTPQEIKASREAFHSYIRWILSLIEGKRISIRKTKALISELETAQLEEIKLSG